MIGELDAGAIEALLNASRIARLAVHPLPGSAHPLLVPIPCFYENRRLVVLSGPGQKVAAMRRNPQVTIEVDRFRATNDWESVVAEGVFRELTTSEERQHAIGIIERRSGEPISLREASILFEIGFNAMTGRFERPS
jgi:nitroimidazol reductase NimA-like FMN-containing flavoprotein (pyridoxamine 5'-phosphate oxidase superfamily)